jgi:hypothetical protein
MPSPVHPPSLFPSDLKPSSNHPLLFDDHTKETCAQAHHDSLFAGLRGRICCPNSSYNWILFNTYPSSDIHLYSKWRN